jgi:NAD(P)-dependent dehydrogenase (short-subunit alcohol dehydrogenase family)
LIDTAVDHFGRIDILILNAGVSAHFLFEEVQDVDVFKRLMDINFFGYLYPTRYDF